MREAGAQQATMAKAAVKTPAARAEAAAAPAQQLPVTRVSLYKNGVGFFEHAGRVTGDQSVTIDFTSAQLDDVLQSLTAVDLGGGRIAGAGYNSTTPLDQQLKALPLALDEDPSVADFYGAIRGARVEVRSGTVSITGRLLNIEEVSTPVTTNTSPAGTRRMITVVGDAGDVRTLELTPSTDVQLLDADLHQDVTRYLQLLASTRNEGLRHLTIEDNGTGARELRVNYISEVPIWKSTYRILFDEPKAGAAGSAAATPTATLQGWSVVDNTTGADWNNVQLSLIAGAPQSFIQPLSQPIYSRRPEIPIAQEAQLTPQTHESGEMAAPPPPATAGGSGGGRLGGVMGGIGVGNGSGSGMGAGSGGNYGGSVRVTGQASSAVISGAALDALSDDSAAFQAAARNSISPNATAAAFDDYFAYNLTEPITIRKSESALVPILQTKIDAERVTLWSRQQAAPLRALWITNTSKLTLDRGSFSIVEDGNFGGEGLLDPIHPDERRLLSYAVDQAVRVTTESEHNSSRVTSISAAKGVVVLRNTQVSEVTYVVRNAADEGRTVIVEHPVRQGYTLDSDPKPVETTPAVYRFRVVTKAGETVWLHVGERYDGLTNYQLSNTNDNTLTYILAETGDNAALKAALQPILAARRHVADMQEALDKVNARLEALRSDEERQRANVTALASADKASRERFVHDLNATEDQIAGAQKDLVAAQANLQAAKDDLAGKIEALQVEEKL